MMVFKEIADLYSCEMIDASFVRAVNLLTALHSSQRISVVVWLSWLMMNSSPFAQSFIDLYNTPFDAQIRHLLTHKVNDSSHNHHAYGRAREPN